MEDDWEALAAKDNVVIPSKFRNINKWAGEDEDDNVKDSWEDDEEEKKDEEKKEVKPVAKAKPKKSLQEKIIEKERQKLEESKEEEEEETELTEEEKLNEKLRLQKIQEEEDLKHAMDTFGVTDLKIDDMNPKTKAEFTELSDAISKKVAKFKSFEEFPNFVEELVRNVCANLTAADLKKIKLTVENLHLEKQRMEKEKEKAKKTIGKGKTKVKLRMEGENLKSNSIGDYGYGFDDDYDDFM
uniref:Eukaryotic translation initiation factor 3 subunit J n=1 Tax=Tabanus bromius TaxID=304241 RepID=A0A0K8TQW0_TABBR